MSNQAMGQELSRVRKLKRAIEAEVELLRSDMENGKIHLRVSQDPKFRQELAEKMVKVSHPGYSKHYQGTYEIDPVEGKIYYSHPSQFSQYSEDDSYKIVDIEYLFDPKTHYGIDIDWMERLEQYPEFESIKQAYLIEINNDDFEDEEFILWLKENPDYEAIIEEIEEEEEQQAIDFALGEILDEIIVKI